MTLVIRSSSERISMTRNAASNKTLVFGSCSVTHTSGSRKRVGVTPDRHSGHTLMAGYFLHSATMTFLCTELCNLSPTLRSSITPSTYSTSGSYDVFKYSSTEISVSTPISIRYHHLARLPELP